MWGLLGHWLGGWLARVLGCMAMLPLFAVRAVVAGVAGTFSGIVCVFVFSSAASVSSASEVMLV